MKIRVPSAFSFAAAVVAAVLAATPGHAQVVEKKLVRAFNNCDYPAPYVFDYSFFTADDPEATLTFSRTHVACSERCQTIPISGDNSCNHSCSASDRSCPNGWTCGACIGAGCFGPCVGGVDVQVGYVVVLKQSRFCEIAACASLNPIGCPPSSCDGSGTCSDPTSNAKNLCMCPDPACPIGQRICTGLRPTVPAADLAYEAFSSGTNSAWILGLASVSGGGPLLLNGTATPTSLAQVRFPTVPGEDYVLVVTWSINPIVSAFNACPDAGLLFSLDTRPDSCGP